MVYITLEELKEILPDILKDWIWEGDESWERIFQEIEQKCHIGKRFKGKKWKKKLRNDVDKLQYFRDHDYEIKVNGIATKVNQLNKEIEEMHRKHIDEDNSITRELARIHSDIRSVKSMAQIAKQRTEVDYTKCSDGYFTEAQVAQNIYNRMANRGATREELDSFREVVKKYDATSYSWNKEKMCETCKYGIKGDAACDVACASCNSDRDKWEAKDND